jgi:hypothetical protein
MSKPDRFWTCSACGQTVLNEPMIVLRHQFAHVKRRPLARNTPKDDETAGDASERDIPDWHLNG